MKNFAFALLVLLTCLSPQLVLGQMLPTPTPTDADRKIEAFLSASLDLARQKLTGPSFENLRNHPGDVLIMNLSIQFHNQGMVDQIINYYGKNARHRVKPADPATLLATNSEMPGPTTTTDKASFLSHLSLLYGVQLIGKGGKEKDEYGSSKTRVAYLEPTGHVLYNYKLPDDRGRVFAGPGIYLAYGLWGKSKYESTGYNESFSAFDKDLGYQRFDFGLSGMIGYQMPQGFSLSFVYELGLVNIDPERGDDKTKNRVFSLNIGYPLSGIVNKLRKK